jgi:FkbM family methyltransferase
VTVLGSQEERIGALAARLSHPDPTQLFFQVAEIAGELTYLQHGVAVDDGDVVLDVGANFGVAAVFFATQCGAGLVHSFEPVRPNFEILSANIAGLPACVAHEEGLSRAQGQAPITYYPGAAAMSGLYADPDRDRSTVRTALVNLGASADEAEQRTQGRYEPETLTCELVTLSAVLRREGLDRVDLLKIDVERAELDVLAGIEEQDWPKIGQVVMEIHDQDGRVALVARELERRGFRVAVDQDTSMRGTDVELLYATPR